MKYFRKYKSHGHDVYRIQVRKRVLGEPRCNISVIHTTDKQLALNAYAECEECGWNVDKLKQIQAKYKKLKLEKALHINPDMYLQRQESGNYIIVKRLSDGKSYSAGGFKSLEEARSERDYLVSIDWDLDKMDLH